MDAEKRLLIQHYEIVLWELQLGYETVPAKPSVCQWCANLQVRSGRMLAPCNVACFFLSFTCNTELEDGSPQSGAVSEYRTPGVVELCAFRYIAENKL